MLFNERKFYRTSRSGFGSSGKIGKFIRRYKKQLQYRRLDKAASRCEWRHKQLAETMPDSKVKWAAVVYGKIH